MKYESLESSKEEIYSYFGTHETQILHSLCGITYPDPDYEIIRDNSPLFSIEYVMEGSGVIMEGENIYNVTKGDFFVLHPGKYHHYYPSPKNPWKKIFLTIDGDTNYPKTLFELFKISETTVFKGLNSSINLEEIFNLFKENEYVPTNEFENMIFILIANLSRISEKNQETNSINKAKAFIDKRLYTRITIDEVCEYVNLHRVYFCRAFKKIYNISPSQYIQKQKIEIAKAMLSKTDMSVNTISNQLAFTDASHFTHCFTKNCGMTPSEYKKINGIIKKN